jgi:hypothetical protein
MNGGNHDGIIARLIQDQMNCTGITENAFFPEEVSFTIICYTLFLFRD